jgi:hypothetical protein
MKLNSNTLKTTAKFLPKGKFQPKNLASNVIKRK